MNRPYTDNEEKLAKYAHDAWVGWMTYLFDRGHQTVDNEFIIDAKSVARCRCMMMNQYSDLPCDEQEGCRLEAKKILEIVGGTEDMREELALLRAEVERLRGVLDSSTQLLKTVGGGVQIINAELAAIHAENVRLRAALEVRK